MFRFALGILGLEWTIGSSPTSRSVPVDFNGDGQSDLVWTNSGNGDRYVWLMNGPSLGSSVYLGNIGTVWQIDGTGDFNSDGQTDLVWTNTATGDRSIWLMNGTSLASAVYLANVSPAWQIAN